MDALALFLFFMVCDVNLHCPYMEEWLNFVSFCIIAIVVRQRWSPPECNSEGSQGMLFCTHNVQLTLVFEFYESDNIHAPLILTGYMLYIINSPAMYVHTWFWLCVYSLVLQPLSPGHFEKSRPPSGYILRLNDNDVHRWISLLFSFFSIMNVLGRPI